MEVIIDKEKCNGCLNCIIVCPRDALSWGNNCIICDTEKCVECGTCVETCEVQAISLPEEKL